MAKRTNGVVWGLVVVLSVLVLGGIGVLSVAYQTCLPEEQRWATLLPIKGWGFGPHITLAEIAYHLRLYHGAADSPPPKRYRLGFVSVRVE